MRKEDLYDKSEMYDKLDNVDDVYNTATMSTLNNNAFSTALKSSGNQSGIKEHLLSSMMADKAKAKLAEQNRMEDINKNITSDIAKANLSRQSFDFGSALGSAFTGGLAGNEFEKSSILMDQLTKGNGEVIDKISGNTNWGLDFFKNGYGKGNLGTTKLFG